MADTAIPELGLEEAWQMLREDDGAVLIDVRTVAEWAFVGQPDLSGIGAELRSVEWVRFPGGVANEGFVAEASAGLDTGQHILFLCRSGARSLAAAHAFRGAGFDHVYNVTAGFEGDLDACGHRHSGWRDSDLPWRQS